jgi:hydroxymethylpyrimidine/phosphomethylpyrimidine kinase
MIRPPVVLSIAGSDNSAGAGIQADLKTFGAFGCYGLTAVTCVVAEIPGKVAAIQPVKPQVVAEQMRLSLEAFPVAAIKTGMLYSTAIINAVAEVLEAHFRDARKRPPLVVDPVMVATSGDTLLQRAAVNAYRKRLFPLATVVTPNLDELAILAGETATDLASMEASGQRLSERYACAFLLKGGHLRGRIATDLLVGPGIREMYSAPFVRGISTHGTGCAYSAAIAAVMACGETLPEAVSRAKRFVTAAIRQHFRWKQIDALNHCQRG